MRPILGTAGLSDRYGITARSSPTLSDSLALLDSARELGIDTLDTAPGYGDAEDLIGQVGSGFRIHTKIPLGADPQRSLSDSLGRLRRAEVDVLYLHNPEAVLEPGRRTVAAAYALIGRGARALGASVYTRAQFDAAVADPRISVIQVPINLLDRRIDDDRLRTAAKFGTRVIARSVLLQGLLAAASPEAAERTPTLHRSLLALRSTAEALGRPPLELAFGWIRARPGISQFVLGVERSAQLSQSLQILSEAALSGDELAALSRIPLPDARDVDPRNWPATRP